MNTETGTGSTAVGSDLRLSVGLGTLLGLLTAGIYWVFVFPHWSRRHAQAKALAMKAHGKSQEDIDNVLRRSQGTVKAGRMGQVLLIVAVGLVGAAFVWELVLRLGPFPLPEEPVWMLLWIALGSVAVTWGSLLFQLHDIVEKAYGADRPADCPWLLRGGKARIGVLATLHFLIALGALPLLIFPPIAASTVNGYLRMQRPDGAPAEA